MNYPDREYKLLNNKSISLNKEVKIILKDTLIQYYIFDCNAPLMIAFSPAGKTLRKNELERGVNAWAFNFFYNKGFNVICFNSIESKHWFFR